MILHLNVMVANFEFIYMYDTICFASTVSNQMFIYWTLRNIISAGIEKFRRGMILRNV